MTHNVAIPALKRAERGKRFLEAQFRGLCGPALGESGWIGDNRLSRFARTGGIVNRLCAAAVLALALALMPVAQAADEAWITIDRGSARHAVIGLAAAGRPGALALLDAGRPDAFGPGARDTDVVVGRISPRDLDLLPEILHTARKRCGGFMWHPTRDEAEKAAALANQPGGGGSEAPTYTIDNGPVVQQFLPKLGERAIRRTIIGLGNFTTRRHNCSSGLSSATWIRNRWQGLAANRPDVTVEFFNHSSTPQPSVILTIPGTTLASEVVVLGAHQDSIAGSGCASLAPGEDDDASGVASLTEVIRVAMLLDYHPLRTVKFMAYAAEEVGLVGSDEIAEWHRDQVPPVNVVGVLQLDMTNYKGSTGDLYVITDYTNGTQNAFVSSLITTYLPGLVQGTTACGYACSDHASWHFQGYPTSFPFEAKVNDSNPWIHTNQDTIDKSGDTAAHALKFSKLAAAYLAEAAKGGFGSN
jgi:leucyl aminopeptidase